MRQLEDLRQTAAYQDHLLDPAHQTRLFMIESALREAGALPNEQEPYPSEYDEQLLKLIDSVAVE